MESELRVLAVTNTYPTNETPDDTPCIKDQIVALRSYGVHVDLLLVGRQNRNASYALAAWRIFQQTFQRRQYSLIHAYYGHCGLLARMQFRYPIVVTFRGSDLLGSRDSTIGKWVAKLVDGVIVMSEEMKRVAGREDAWVIPFGVNTALFAPGSKAEARRALGLAMDKKIVLFPWNPARPEKRFDLVAEAVRLVRNEHAGVELMPVYNQPHERVAKYMNASDALVLASDYEGSPMAIREAMACNLPIVSVNVGDSRQIIEHTEGCYLCTREPSDLARTLAVALARGRPTAGARVVQQADAACGAAQVLQVYRGVLKSHQRNGGTHCE